VDTIVEIQGLRKTYRTLRKGPRRALDGFDMVVRRGEVHGFLGPNGSGKTTTLRTLLGLVGADDGTMSLLGVRVPDGLSTVVSRVGAIVESPQFFLQFTGRRTLELLSTAADIPRARIDEVLDLVGLRERARDRVKTYSLGMKQRLAVASALLKTPEVLILDEPANGLDPAGIREMRDMMRGLADSGVTVIVSSHILGEIQMICDSVTIIAQGRRVAAGPVSDVLALNDKGEHRVKVSDAGAAAAVLTQAGVRVRQEADHLVVTGADDPARITEALGREGIWLSELTPLTPDLESVFLQLTGTTPEPGAHLQIDGGWVPVPANAPEGVTA
jgi:ABC-2 type transport system ATP-binding protein